MKKRGIAVGVLGALALGVWLNDASWLAPQPDEAAKLYVHRGVHQPYERAGPTNGTCTASARCR